MANRSRSPSKKIVTTPKIDPIELKEISYSADEKKQTINIDAKLNAEIVQSSDTQKIQSSSTPQSMDADIVASSDEIKQIIRSPISSNIEVVLSPDTQKVQIPPVSQSANIDILTSSDEIKQTSRQPILTNMEVVQSPDTQKVQKPAISQVTDINITASSDEVKQTSKSPVLTNIEVAQSPDTQKVQKPAISSITNIEVVQSSDENRVTSRLPVAMNANVSESPDLPYEFIEFPFNGQWLPHGDTVAIGANNYSVLENWRYTDFGLEGVGGHTRASTDVTGLTTGIMNGIQLITDYTIGSYIIVQANTATHRNMYYNDTAIPTQRTTAYTPIYNGTTRSAGIELARFSRFPKGNIACCNQVENLIWAGNEKPVDAFFEVEDVGAAFYYHNSDECKDLTDLINSTKTGDEVEIQAAADAIYLVGSTRPLKALNITVGTVNTNGAAVMTLQYYSRGTAGVPVHDFANCTKTDNTDALVIAGTHTVDITATCANEVPYLFNGHYLFFYKLSIDLVAGNPTISNITLNCARPLATTTRDMQPIYDLWDGMPRTCTLFVDNSSDVIYTLECASESLYVSASSQTAPFNNLGAENSGSERVLMFNEPTTAIKFKFHILNAAVNSYFQVDYWNGAWTATGLAGSANIAQRDTTRLLTAGVPGTSSAGQSGYIFWNTFDDEVKVTMNGVTGYAYRLCTSNVAFDGTVAADTITGVPKYRIMDEPYIFPFQYQDRAMLCGSAYKYNKNQVLFSKSGQSDVWNGEDSSGRDNEVALYIGSGEALTGAAEIMYHSVNSPTTSALFFKNTETYLLDGYSPSTFQIHRISDMIGCSAPLTISSAEIRLGDQSVQKNVVIWASYDGVKMYVEGNIHSLDGIEPYFERDNELCITRAYANIMRGWYDPEYNEYNLVMPSGTAATNVWLAYDLRRLKWFKKVPDYTGTWPAVTYIPMFPTGAFPVTDTKGNKFIYGYQSDGYLMQLENGLVWNETDGTDHDIENKVITADVLPAKSIWDETRLYYLQTIFKCDDDGDITISYYKDGKTTAETVSTLPTSRSIASIDYENASAVDYRIRHLISYMNLESWSHRFKFVIANCATATNKPRLLGWGLAYQKRQNSFLDRDELRVITIDATHNTLSFTSSQGGPVLLDCADAGSYRIHELADAIEDKLNANAVLTGAGPVITFIVTVSESKLKIDSGVGNTIAFTQGQDGDTTFGFRTTQGAAQTITADYYPEETV